MPTKLSDIQERFFKGSLPVEMISMSCKVKKIKRLLKAVLNLWIERSFIKPFLIGKDIKHYKQPKAINR